MAENKTLARPYAKAAFQHALKSNQIENWSAMLKNMAEIVKDNRVSKIITNPGLTSKKRSEFFTKWDNLFDKGFCDFIKVVADYNRLNLIPEMSLGFDEIKFEHNKEININIVSAVELNSSQKELIKNAVHKNNQKKINLIFSIDEKLIGGLIIKTGDLVIDSSIKGQLKKLVDNLLG